MTTSNWRTNLGGALGTFGTSMIGVGTLTQLSQLSPKTNILEPWQLAAMWWVAFAGFIISGVGKFCTAYYAADAKQLEVVRQDTQAQIKDLHEKLNLVPKAIDSSDTSEIKRVLAEPPPAVDQANKPV